MSAKTGEQEKRCLELVKKGIFCNCDKNKKWSVKIEARSRYFGLLAEDRMEIENILQIAQENPNSTLFPDFIFSNGFIEHFQVTSSYANRKGATYKRELKVYQDRVEKEMQELEKQWARRPCVNEVRSKQWEFHTPLHNYEYLEKSFQEIWEKHIGSLQKYTGNTDIGIFMVEYAEWAIGMVEQVYDGWIDGMSSGDMRNEEEFKYYRLSRDRNLLEFVYQYKEKVKYVIFVYETGSGEDFEIIRTDKIPYLLKLLPWDFLIYPFSAGRIDVKCNTSIPWENK